MKRVINIVLILWYLLPANTTFAQGDAEQLQAKKDDARLQEYFAEHKISPVKTESGLYYVITKKGTGRNAQPNELVTLNYTGKKLDGTEFDSNIDPRFQHPEPLTFVLGAGNVIEGWDVGIQYLNRGAEATLYVPSGLAYGREGSGHVIRPNSILVFDVELTEINHQ